MTTDIVVLGGGYTGVWSARAIARAVRSGSLDGVRIRLVSAAPDHSFHGWTAEVITGQVRPERARVPLARLLPGVEIVTGSAVSVDPGRRTVRVATDNGERTLGYHQLVVGVGSKDAAERVPGLAEHAWSLKDPDGLAALRVRLAELEQGAAVVVAGAGLTGVEAATAIVQQRPDVRVLLAHPGSQALPMLRPRFRRIADYAVAEARRAGVEFLPGARLCRVTADGADLGAAGFVASGTVVSTIGQTPVALPDLDAFPRDEQGRLITDQALRVAPGIWAGGDVAAVPHPSRTGPCPANALWAIHHGKRIGSNIVRVLRGDGPRPFTFPGLGQGASLGVGRGAAELYGVQLTGWPAWLARWVFFHWFMPSRAVAARTAAEWLTGRGQSHQNVHSAEPAISAPYSARSSVPCSTLSGQNA
ncbi:MAG: FAD-dependent oxidoreductase [Micropruina sp.]|uniref:NAD(P)/FAD-dependent oxidoreductase n=1 Tax=Micropruina sp. TaxID=2737536 RepID=UPI0039E56386